MPSRQEGQSHHKGEEKNRRSFDGAAAGASKEPRQVSLGFRGTRPPSPSVLLYGSRLHALRFKGTDATLQQVHDHPFPQEKLPAPLLDEEPAATQSLCLLVVTSSCHLACSPAMSYHQFQFLIPQAPTLLVVDVAFFFMCNPTRPSVNGSVDMFLLCFLLFSFVRGCVSMPCSEFCVEAPRYYSLHVLNVVNQRKH